MIKYAAVSIVFFVVALGLFTIPLLLKHHVLLPKRHHVVRGDSYLLSKEFPSFWCEGESLTSSSIVDAYLFDSNPQVNLLSTNRSVSHAHIKLPNKKQEYWGFHLLQGTNVSVWACVKLSGASVTLVRSKSNLQQCLTQNEISFNPVEDSLEEESESESDQATSSISSSQGVVSNETEDPFVCSRALEHRTLASNYRCNSPSHVFHKKFLFSHRVEKTDFYYFVFISDTYLDIIPNEFSVELVFDRTFYSYSPASSSCTNSTHCTFPLTIGSDSKIVVHLPNANGSLQEDLVVTSCMPRKGVFFMFYLAFTIVLFLCAFQ